MDTKNYNYDQLKAVKQLTYALCRLIESCEPKQYNNCEMYKAVFAMYSIADFTLLRRMTQPDITDD